MELKHLPPPPSSAPLLGFLIAGFVLLALGLSALTVRRTEPVPLASAATTRRAAIWTLLYGLCAACFARVLQPALLGDDRSPWLLALGDVIAVTLALSVWVMVLAENRRFEEFGLGGDRDQREEHETPDAIAPLGLYLAAPVTWLISGHSRITTDGLVFACIYSTLGSAFPEELLLRGYLMGSLGTRVKTWVRIATPAIAFAALRGMRLLPGPEFPPGAWLLYVFGMVLPLGVWWGLVRELSGGSLWPGMISHAILQFVLVLASTSIPTGP